MIICQFIFQPGTYDEEFLALDTLGTSLQNERMLAGTTATGSSSVK